MRTGSTKSATNTRSVPPSFRRSAREARAPGLLALAGVGADAHRQHEIVHERAVGALILARVGRIGARRKQAVVHLGGSGRFVRELLRVARNQPADFVDARM